MADDPLVSKASLRTTDEMSPGGGPAAGGGHRLGAERRVRRRPPDRGGAFIPREAEERFVHCANRSPRTAVCSPGPGPLLTSSSAAARVPPSPGGLRVHPLPHGPAAPGPLPGGAARHPPGARTAGSPSRLPGALRLQAVPPGTRCTGDRRRRAGLLFPRPGRTSLRSTWWRRTPRSTRGRGARRGRDDRLLATGTAVLSGTEMLAFNYGER